MPRPRRGSWDGCERARWGKRRTSGKQLKGAVVPGVGGTHYFSTHGWLAVAKIVSCQLEPAQQQRREREGERDGPGSTTWRGPAPSPEPLKTGAVVGFDCCLPPLLGPAIAVSSSSPSSPAAASSTAGCFCLDFAAARISAKASTLPPAAALLIVSFLDRWVRAAASEQQEERESKFDFRLVTVTLRVCSRR